MDYYCLNHPGLKLLEQREQIKSVRKSRGLYDSDIIQLFLFVVPSSPYNFTTSSISATSVQFSWLFNDSEIINSFIVERRSISDWVTVNSVVPSPWFEDQNLTPFTKFMYRVSAKNALGKSKPGGSFNVSTTEGGGFALVQCRNKHSVKMIIDHRFSESSLHFTWFKCDRKTVVHNTPLNLHCLYSFLVPSSPAKLEAKSPTLTNITVYWEPPREPRGQLTSIIYEIRYKESTILPGNEENIVKTMDDHMLKIQKLKSNTLYVIRVRAGRQTDGVLRWSNYKSTRIRTLRKGKK
jgi:hypothetical protein